MASLNVGVLGHVDCGKTSLTKRIAEIASTSAFDAHALKGGRKNTLDLGFSSMTISGRRLALIDCPGHAALIRAVLAASTVFDIAIVVVDASNGVQPQTAEHLLLCSIFCPNRIVIVLNKIDLIEKSKIPDVEKQVRKALKAVGVSSDSSIVAMSLNDSHFAQESIEKLKEVLSQMIFEPLRACEKKMILAADHCFNIKGKGVVITGTVLQGILRVNEDLEIPKLQVLRKPKMLETWKQPVEEVRAGERAAVLVSNIDADSFSRTLIASPGSLRSLSRCIASVEPVPFFRSSLLSGTKMHISIGFETVMAECQFLRPQPECPDEFEQLRSMESPCVVQLTFERAVFVADEGNSPCSFLMASRLEQQRKGCRFAFHGRVLKIVDDTTSLKRFTRKCRQGVVERVEGGRRTAICCGMLKKETKIELFKNMIVQLETGEEGRIEGSFGRNGKIRLTFSSALPDSLPSNKKRQKPVEDQRANVSVAMLSQRLVRIVQSRCFSKFSNEANSASTVERAVEFDEDGLPKDYKAKTLKAGSRRLDTFLNRATGKSSSQIEKLIMGGKVRVNEEVHTKKAYNVQKKDIVDVWNKAYQENAVLAHVERTEIVDYEVTEQGYSFQVKSWRNFFGR
ncbi:unnamed protein product [Caenorhabditis auriculariae]|uniref:Tr-type G domain-containing protein n=1 Tax=Caenorhabditis auriculariae TaxID=2777116 RepID=A0A8S1GN87_9PELO|nr:unnamed protein product [Caenorhabditis auriculariae]